ncbi:hypothetical protein ANN_08845 [Periplaneta americana]|uniref:Reverse transcriptase domain-containing protein n=1 Tax=Periplaneta americana TaxID=6978 RepID=A0ABQ8T2L6_PERAM|nr:hypothetical protein ANN_08845 [Periplaneta americana]
MLGENPQTIRENTEILLEASKAISLEVNPEKTKYMIMSREKNIVRNGNIKIGDLSFKGVEKFKYLGATVTNINDTQEEIKRRINMGNACYYSVEKLLSSSLLSKNLKVQRSARRVEFSTEKAPDGYSQNGMDDDCESMSPRSNDEIYPAILFNWLRENPDKNPTRMYQLVLSATGWMDGTAPLPHRHNNTDELIIKSSFVGGEFENRGVIVLQIVRLQPTKGQDRPAGC